MRRALQWLVIVTSSALTVAAVVAWVVVLTDRHAAATASVAAPAAYAPPKVEVVPGVDVDRDEVAAFVAQVVNDPRGWHVDMGRYTLRVVKPGTEGVDKAGGYYIGRAYIDQRYVVISSYAWTTLGPHFAAVGGTLTDQRTWIVLHELGHLIGHPAHESCPAPGQPAPVMRTATYALDGCTLNVWPNP